MHSIILVEDHPLLVDGIKSLLHKTDNFYIKKSYSTGDEGLKAIKYLQPDFAIIDLNLPGLPGETIIKELFLNNSKTKVIVLSRQKYIPQITHLLKLNISGYIVKDSAGDELLLALNQIFKGIIYISPRLKTIMKKMGYKTIDSSNINPKDILTSRELEIARLLYSGYASKDIASKLSISLIRVRVHTKNILTKLNLNSLEN